MKKCPTCDTTFEDSMRFCQVDGTLLVDDSPVFDPYATIVAEPFPSMETTDETPSATEADEVEAEPFVHQTVGSVPIAEPDDVLDLPQADPLKTMYASDGEMEAAFATGESAEIIDVPAIEEIPEPEPPSFIAPEVQDSSFGAAPPPSPFSVSENVEDLQAASPPMFDESASSTPPYDEPATIIQSEFSSQFDPTPAAPVAEWTPPPPVPDASWQNQEIGSNTPFQPTPAGTGSVNQTLPIISLVLGIISLCCYISPITGIAALITGYLGMKNVNNDPQNFGGKGLAIAGMITGGVFFLIGFAYYVVVILIYAGVFAGSMLQGY